MLADVDEPYAKRIQVPKLRKRRLPDWSHRGTCILHRAARLEGDSPETEAAGLGTWAWAMVVGREWMSATITIVPDGLEERGQVLKEPDN